jgi:glycosyltransferase involved in cell wall biosynthesis
VLHVAQPVDAGVAVCVRDLAVDQRAHGLDARVACPPAGPLPEWLDAAGVPRAAWPATRSPGPWVPAETVRLARLVRGFDLVHLHSSKAGLAGRLAIRGRRATVFQPHAWSFDAVTGPVRTATLAWERRAARWTHVVVCVSAAERDAGVAAGIAPPRWAVVPNGADLGRWTPEPKGPARKHLGLPVDRHVIICVGRLSRQKGQDVLLAAAREVDADVVLVGDGPDRAALEAAAPANVRFAGRSDDVAAWYAAADAVAVPSRWEGMPLVVLEALACGRPVVGSDVSGMREAGAVVVPPEDPAALAAALRECLAHPSDTHTLRENVRDLRETTAAIRGLYADLSGAQ